MWCNKVTEKEFENILNDCLERILTRDETVEDCLNAYPQHSDALKSLLQTALLTKNATKIGPRPEFKASARYQFRTLLQETKPQKNNLFAAWRFRWATALTAILVMLMASGGLVVAAGTSMPDNPLYSVKLAVERMQINLTFSEIGKANLYAKFSNRRVSEIIHMAQKGDAGQVTASANRLGDQLVTISNLTLNTARTSGSGITNNGDDATQLSAEKPVVPAPGTTALPSAPFLTLLPEQSEDKEYQDFWVEESEYSEFLNLLLQDGMNNSTALRDLLATTPESVRSALLEAIVVLEAGYTNIFNNISE